MVQLLQSGKARPEFQWQSWEMGPVKLEAEDSLEDEHGPLNKRSKLSCSLVLQQCDPGPNSFPLPPSQYNPLEEPSPLGLRLRKSPSLLDLIQMTLSRGNAPKSGSQAKKEHKVTSAFGTTDKLKASNFPASLLRIGTWEYKSRYEGDLVAKCYFAKHKLVWEVLDGGLKNKIEIQWSDIMALKASYPDEAPGTLDVVLARQPLFFRETNPQPRKHTLWQATSDFTGGQASTHRRHFLQCPQGLLGKHFEKLIQCDPRLNSLSQQGEIALESPYFEPQISVFDGSSEPEIGFDSNGEEGQAFLDLRDAASPSRDQSSYREKEEQGFFGRLAEQFRHETPSPSSVMDTHDLEIEEIRSGRAEEFEGLVDQDQIKVPLLASSMSVSHLISHLEQRISEQRTASNFILSAEERQSLEILEDIRRCLFNDSQNTSASDEQCIMSRVNSLCCLLQKDPTTLQNSQTRGNNLAVDKRIGEPSYASGSACESRAADDYTVPESDSTGVMSRKDSVGELLLNLPRIASLSQFFFNVSEDYDNQAR